MSTEKSLVSAESTKERKVFALLIGIDHYELPGANLGGCVRDSQQVEAYLREQTENADQCLHLMTLHSPLEGNEYDDSVGDKNKVASYTQGKPTRTGIINAFLGFLTQSTENDVVFIHYSGHGSFETRPEELWHLDAEENSEHRAETLVCQDSYTKDENGDDIPALRDKEMSWLLAKVAENSPHIILLMDCCNSSGNTRFKQDGTQTRFTSTAGTKNSIESYVFYQQDSDAKTILKTKPQDFFLPEARHVALYAGYSYQLAKETRFEEGRFGVFTYYLLQALRTTKGNISYRNLLKIVRNKAAQTVVHQSPQWYASEPKDLDLFFLGRTSTKHSPAYTLFPTANKTEARLDAGSLHALLRPSVGKTLFHVFKAYEKIDELNREDVQQAELISLAPGHSILKFANAYTFPEGETFLKATIHTAPLNRTKVCIELEIAEKLCQLDEVTDADMQQRMQLAKHTLENLIRENPHLELVEKSKSNWQFRLFIYHYQEQDKLRIAEKDSVAARVAPVQGWRERSLTRLCTQLTHIAKWERTLALDNPQSIIIKPELIDLEVIGRDEKVKQNHGGEIVLDANGIDENKPELKFKVRLKKPYHKPLYCALLRLKPDFGVDTTWMAPDAHLGTFEYLEDGQRIQYDKREIYVGSHIAIRGRKIPTGRYIGFPAPQAIGEQEVKEFVYYMKLIVSTEEFSADYLYQSDLERPVNTRMGRKKKPANRLEGMLQNIQLRNDDEGASAGSSKPKFSDWWTRTIRIVVKL